MDFKDYYKILGVDKSAGAEEIKKAYRKLAVKFHPDKNPGNKLAEEKFKEINEANEVLSNPENRKKYDAIGQNWNNYQQHGGREGTGQGFDWSQWSGRSGNDFREGDFSDFFENLFRGSYSAGNRNQTRKAKGQDYQSELWITLEDAYHGTSRQLDLGGSKLELKIKRGIQDGQVLRLKGKGGNGANGGPDGDLYITVHINPHPLFKRNENDLTMDLNLDLYTAVLGGSVLIKAPGKSMKVNISRGTPNGKLLRIKGLGMPVYGSENKFGDLYANVHVNIPTRLTEKEIELFKQLAEIKNKSHAEII